MNGWWPGRVPLRLRVFVRSAFLLLALATIGLAAVELREEKHLGYRSYQQLFDRSILQITSRLQHPSGQLALLNPTLPGAALTPLRPLVLPFSAIDFDDKLKAQQAVEMAGCLVEYPAHAQLCVAVGNNAAAGGFIYVVGSFASGPLVAHRLGDLDLSRAHRLLVEVSGRGHDNRWIAPLQLQVGSARAQDKISARLAGFAVDGNGRSAGRPDREFRGWLWQDKPCMDTTVYPQSVDCIKRAFFSVRLPMALLREVLNEKPKMIWPPQDLAQIRVRVQALAPGNVAALFDSDQPGAMAPFALSDLKAQLLPGETLRIRRLNAVEPGDVIVLAHEGEPQRRVPRLLNELVAQLPVRSDQQPLSARQIITTAAGEFELILTADTRRADPNLAPFAGRLSLLVGAMLLCILLTWAAIEMRIIHRITLLTKRAAAVKQSAVAYDGLQLDLHGLLGSDELGLLAGVLSDLLQRIRDDAKREHLRVEQEKTMWQAVGHEIRSPLQSLAALHNSPDDPSVRYVDRMRRAVRVLYGGAAPSEAILSASLQMKTLDIQEFLQTVADNAAHAGIARVEFDGLAGSIIVKADEHSFEDVVTHVLTNADRYRTPDTAIRINLHCESEIAEVRIRNHGPQISTALLGKIFEYGVSDDASNHADGRLGQGLFVARTYMAKMGGTIEALNVAEGVEFVLKLATA